MLNRRDLPGPRELLQSIKQRFDAALKRALAWPLPIDKLLDCIDRFEAKIDYLLCWLDLSVANAADEIFSTVRNTRNALQSHLRCRAFYGVHRPEETMDRLGIVRCFNT